ncbi:MAG: gliding motility-associated C-terminal domain-containing protein, partial [Bacteroidia bacterium]|nr:gliding motility-associated C-terminal domain-containing protein [Bacteroidia bacterium]
ITYSLNTSNATVTYIGTAVGSDTLCLKLVDDMGRESQTTMIINVRDPSTDVYIDTIFLNQEEFHCLDLTEVGNPVSFFNDCITVADTSVSFALDQNTGCIDYLGLAVGRDTGCMVLCNAAGVCDTTLMIITVVESPDPPIAVDDSVTTLIGTPIVMDVKQNDTIYGAIDTIYLATQPIWGEAFVNLDCSVTYNASEQFCERYDELQYVVCTQTACDTATVTIWIECTDIKIFNAMSPNGDGLNDIFFIANIEDFPNNEINIYNRWGNQVFSTTGYNNKENNWDGTWQGDNDLPDGTYYYELWLHDENKRFFSGFIELFR